MKYLIAAASLFLSGLAFAAQGGRPDVYTTRFFYLKPEVTFEQAKQSLDSLNTVLSKLKGFEKRNVFFDKDQKVWIDQIKWKHADAAKSGDKTLTNDPAFTNLAKLSDPNRTTQYQAERVTEFDAPK